ncbi:MAG: hypothetical protein GWP18_02275 [Proteobacteria bacterium]|nr:hypothetical protein [Pseudomonadota bacterium]
MAEIDLSGAIDLHAHVAPDLRPRKMDGLDLAREAAERGMRAILIKSHFSPTSEGAYYISQTISGVQLFGGLVLNEHIGGFNPKAVDTALRLGAREIWMPTDSATNHRRHEGLPGGLSLTVEGKLRDEVHEILDLIADADVILGTGHLAVDEIQVLVRAAREAGIERILVTHPEHPVIDMTVPIQEELAEQGVMFERCYVSVTMFDVPLERIAEEIRAVGTESTVLATDYGQPHNVSPPEGLAEFAGGLAALGFSQRELDEMLRHNPAVLLGLELGTRDLEPS